MIFFHIGVVASTTCSATCKGAACRSGFDPDWPLQPRRLPAQARQLLGAGQGGRRRPPGLEAGRPGFGAPSPGATFIVRPARRRRAGTDRGWGRRAGDSTSAGSTRGAAPARLAVTGQVRQALATGRRSSAGTAGLVVHRRRHQAEFPLRGEPIPFMSARAVPSLVGPNYTSLAMLLRISNAARRRRSMRRRPRRPARRARTEMWSVNTRSAGSPSRFMVRS